MPHNFPQNTLKCSMYYQTLTTKMFSLTTTRRMMLARRNYYYSSSFHASAVGKKKTSSSSSFSALNNNNENNVVVLVEDDDYDDDARRESSSSSSSSNINTNNNGHIVLVDGMSFLFRAFYGFQARSDATKLINSKGEDVGVLHAYAHAMCALLESKPSHFAVCFDSKGKTFRHEMFVDYKTDFDKQTSIKNKFKQSSFKKDWPADAPKSRTDIILTRAIAASIATGYRPI